MLRAIRGLARCAAAAQQIRVDPGRRTGDRHSAGGLGVEVGRTRRADDRVRITLRGHGMKGFEQKRGPDPLFPLALEHASRAEERFRGRVVAREAEHILTTLRPKTGDGQSPEADLALARPALAEVLAHPGHDDVPLWREGAAQIDPGVAECAHARP